uniref:Uncharacterized protein n=1 Tax=Meloidogyne enterolobii TaxID=390850 RepID=A0A6V7TKX7_MELEN|nr:unnamed protein product [Meloidogyne enterolobii]
MNNQPLPPLPKNVFNNLIRILSPRSEAERIVYQHHGITDEELGQKRTEMEYYKNRYNTLLVEFKQVEEQLEHSQRQLFTLATEGSHRLLQDEEDNNRKRGEILNELWEIFDNIALIYKQQHGREMEHRQRAYALYRHLGAGLVREEMALADKEEEAITDGFIVCFNYKRMMTKKQEIHILDKSPVIS